jgi:hypothetical protein
MRLTQPLTEGGAYRRHQRTDGVFYGTTLCLRMGQEMELERQHED